jgi:hypothetical protein
MSESLDDPNLKNLEAAFRALTPATPALARDRMLTGLFAAATVVLGWNAAMKPEPPDRIVYLPAPVAPARGSAEQRVVAQTRSNTAAASVFSLLLLGAPDYLPAQPARAREIEEFAGEEQPFPAAGNLMLPPTRDRLGLPPGSLGNPPSRANDFGPIRRGDV